MVALTERLRTWTACRRCQSTFILLLFRRLAIDVSN